MSLKRTALFSLVLILPVVLGAQTLSGTINSNETWQGIIQLNGDVVISKNARVTILPGTQIKMASRQDSQLSGNDKNLIEIIVNGELIAEGTDDNEIVFTSAAKDKRMGDWFGIVIQNRKSTTSLTKVVIEYGFDGITVIASRPNIYSSVIQYNFNSGITCKINANPKIIDNTIYANGWAGVFSHKKAKPILSGNRISMNDYGVIIMKSGEANLGNLKGKGIEKNPGQNLFLGNLSYALDNHSKYAVYAQNNTWTGPDNIPASDVSNLIYDEKDNPGSGAVYYKPVFGQGSQIFAAGPGPAKNVSVENQDSPAINMDNVAQQTEVITKNEPEVESGVNVRKNSSTEKNKTDLVANKTVEKGTASLPVALGQKKVAKGDEGNTNKNIENKTRDKVLEDVTSFKKSIVKPKSVKINKPVQEWQIDQHHRQYIGKRPRPEYPSIAYQTKTTGQVIIEVIANEKGLIGSTRILKSSSEIFNEVAMGAVKKIKYVPMTMKGEAVKVKLIERYVFDLR